MADRTLLYARDGSALVKLGGSPFEEAVNRGRVYAVANQSGVTSQAGLSATTPVLTLHNPPGSGVNAVIWYVNSVYLVAFVAAAAVWVALGGGPEAAEITATLTTSHRNLLTGKADGNKVRALTAATLPAAPVGVHLLGAGLTGAITTLPVVQTLERWLNGALILRPGFNMSVQTSTASGASAQLNEYIWEEVDEK